jgi:hypothetical protein
LLSRGYWVASSGNVTDEVWMEYIKNQVPAHSDKIGRGFRAKAAACTDWSRPGIPMMPATS